MGHAGGVLSVAFSPDGTRIVSGGIDGTVRLWTRSKAKPAAEPFKDVGDTGWVFGAGGMVERVGFEPEIRFSVLPSTQSETPVPPKIHFETNPLRLREKHTLMPLPYRLFATPVQPKISLELDTSNLRGVHFRPCCVEGVIGVDRPAGVLDHEGFEFGRARVERGKGDAIVGRKTAGEHALDAARVEERCKPGGRLAVRLDESGIGIDARVHALA